MSKYLSLTITLTFFFSSPIFAVDYVFNGPGTWNTPSAWQGGLIPPNELLHPHTITINANVSTENYFMYNLGTINVSVGAILITNNMSFVSNWGTMNVYGTLRNNDMFLNENGTLNIYGQFQNWGLMVSDGAMNVHSSGSFINNTTAGLKDITINAGGNFINNGLVKGNATWSGNFNNASTLAPGLSPGSYEITGNYTAASTSVHNFEVGGTTAGNFDYLSATGSITLNGTLNVALINGFTPTTAHDLIILSGPITGTFSTVDIPAPYTLVYTPTSVLLRNLSVLPVSFLKVNAKKSSNKVQLSWEVKEENLVNHYEVEKSYNGREFSKIAIVSASGQDKYYHEDIQPGDCYYRIKSIDLDGKYKYSPIVNYKDGRSMITLKAFPTPAIHSVLLQHSLAMADSRIELYSMEGRIVKMFRPVMNTNQTTLDISFLPAGHYFVSFINQTGQKETIKIIKD